MFFLKFFPFTSSKQQDWNEIKNRIHKLEEKVSSLQQNLGQLPQSVATKMEGFEEKLGQQLGSIQALIQQHADFTESDTKRLKAQSQEQEQVLHKLDEALGKIEIQQNHLLKAIELVVSSQVPAVRDIVIELQQHFKRSAENNEQWQQQICHAVAGTDETLSGLANKLQQMIECYPEKIAKLGQQIAEKSATLTQHLEARLTAMAQESEAQLTTQAQQLGTQLTAISQQLEAQQRLNEKLVALERRLEDNQAIQQQMAEKLTAIEQQIQEAKNHQQNLAENWQEHRQSISQIWTQTTTDITQRINGLQFGWQPLADSLASLESEIKEQNSKELNRLGKTIFKLNNLLEATRDNFQKGYEAFLEEQSQYRQREQHLQKKLPDSLRDKEIALARNVFPLMDALDAAVETGENLVTSTYKPVLGFFKKQDHGEALKSWLEGIKMMRKRVLNLLQDLEIEPIPSLGQPFDPKLHHALGVEKGADNIILQEITRGYRTANKILRYADVIVGQKDA